MTTLATSDLSWAAIQAILGDTGDASLAELCNHVNVEPLGLDPTYCAGDGVTARHNTLKATPYKMGNFRGYIAPSNKIFVAAFADLVVYRCVYGEKLHSSKYWDFGFQYYTGSAYSDWEFAHGLRVCYTDDYDDPACTLGFVNKWVYGPIGAGSPIWNYRFQNQDDPLPAYIYPTDPVDVLPAGSYYWYFSPGSPSFVSDDFGDNTMSVQMTIADYLLSDPDLWEDYSGSGGSDSFGVWTGLYSNSVVIGDSMTLTGATNGTGNRTQNFTVPNNTTGFPITHHILTTASGQPSSHVYIFQDA